MNLDEYSKEEIIAATELLPSLWVVQNELVNESGFPIEFSNHRFLLDVYNDLSPLQVLLKPPQIGATVMNTLKSFYAAKKLGKQIIYTLPTQGDVHDMVGGSINRIIAQNPILMSWVKDHDTVEQKTVGDSIIFYRGTFTAKQAMMIPSDLNIHDEVDASDPQVISQYETRLQAKANGMRWYFSHPSLEGHGVDIYWKQSDKKEWYVTCEHCKKEQILTFPESIDVVAKKYVCKHCHLDLSDETRRMGEWKPTAVGAFSGYHISQLMCPWITAEAILKTKDDPMKDAQYFSNYVLGLPHAESDDKISPETVLKNVVPDINQQLGQIIIGVDTGLPIYFSVMNKEGVFYHGTCRNGYADLESMLLRWPQSIIVSDQGGDLIGIRKLQSKYKGRVFLCWFTKETRNKEMMRWGENEEYGKVLVDRNRLVQMIVDYIGEQRILFNGSREDWQPFFEHAMNVYRVKDIQGEDENDPQYGWRWVWN
jgi:hypothetical protein